MPYGGIYFMYRSNVNFLLNDNFFFAKIVEQILLKISQQLLNSGIQNFNIIVVYKWNMMGSIFVLIGCQFLLNVDFNYSVYHLEPHLVSQGQKGKRWQLSRTLLSSLLCLSHASARKYKYFSSAYSMSKPHLSETRCLKYLGLFV